MGDWTANYGVAADWKKSILSPGATQMIFLKNLMLSKSYYDRVPAQELVIDNGEKYDRIAATRGKNYAMFYVYNGVEFKVATDKLKFITKKASWFNPRTGEKQLITEHRNTTVNIYNPPGKGDGNDWVLILEK